MPPSGGVRTWFALTILWAPIAVWAEEPAPAADFDHDGVPDTDDDCPTDPGAAENAGCKAAPKVVPAAAPVAPAAARVDGDQLVLSRPVEFETGSARLAGNAAGLIQAMAQAMAEVPAERMLLVRGHTDNRGARAANLLLSRRRAEAVMKALVAAGVAEDRVRSEGLGPDEPVASNANDEGRGKNRRVEFKIVERGAPGGKKKRR